MKRQKKKLKMLRYKLFILWALRYPAALVDSIREFRKKHTRRFYIGFVIALFLYVFTKPMDLYLKSKVIKEWHKRKNEPNGSEMYLFLKDNKLFPTDYPS